MLNILDVDFISCDFPINHIMTYLNASLLVTMSYHSTFLSNHMIYLNASLLDDGVISCDFVM